MGAFNKRLPEARLDAVPDPRHQPSCRWRLATILKVIAMSMVAGCKSFKQMEALSKESSLATRKKLGIPRRLPDTTARETVIRLEPDDIRPCIHRQVRAAHRRKALPPKGLPFGVVALDGKVTAVKGLTGPSTQIVRQGTHRYGLVRTTTALLVSACARPCIDAVPIPRWTNEMGHYPEVLEGLDKAVRFPRPLPSDHLRRGRLRQGQRTADPRVRLGLPVSGQK